MILAKKIDTQEYGEVKVIRGIGDGGPQVVISFKPNGKSWKNFINDFDNDEQGWQESKSLFEDFNKEKVLAQIKSFMSWGASPKPA